MEGHISSGLSSSLSFAKNSSRQICQKLVFQYFFVIFGNYHSESIYMIQFCQILPILQIVVWTFSFVTCSPGQFCLQVLRIVFPTTFLQNVILQMFLQITFL